VVRAAFAGSFAAGLRPASGLPADAACSVSDAVALLEMFTCERLHARMTVNACARQWLKANTATDRHGKRVEPPPWDSLHHCLRCPVGAQRCGRTIDPIADAVAALKPICPRCLRVADRIVNARGERPLCVSCYNRDREVRIGKNAKGEYRC
jgi:hypothetical protein